MKSASSTDPAMTGKQRPDNDFMLYAVGPVAASVCTSLTNEQAEDRINIESPTGISSRWRVSEEATFKGGEPNGTPCPDCPTTHRHLLFNC